MKHTNHITNTYYGSWEKLLELIDQKLDFYIHIFQIFMLLKDCGLRPGYMLDATHPAYLGDQIADHCLATYDPQEPMDSALERCITDKLHENITNMELADLSKAKVENSIWEQFQTESLIRLVWRHADQKLQIPIYLDKTGSTELSDPFLLEVDQGHIQLTQCTLNRVFDMDMGQMDYETYRFRMCRLFQLATEDYGYFAPSYVWLSHRKMKRG